jgi:hypothetical protein
MIWNERQQWKQMDARKAHATILSSTEYQNCCAVFKDWEFILEEAIKDMLVAIDSFAAPNYIVKEDKIGYKELDTISFKIVYGYKTMFAYFNEHELGKITQKSLHDHIAIGVSCGKFSYAEIPHKFDIIMGVSGTLETLSEPERSVILNNYKILKYTYTPSVFGKNNRIFHPDLDIHIVDQDHYLGTIKDEISRKLTNNTRAVLVFFESKTKLDEFANSSYCDAYNDQLLIISEELSEKEKESYIRRATAAGQVTLLTRSFGRGTDFTCVDDTVRANSGIHVLQTFLSEEHSEETQIMGRTARQGDPGSYSMVLLDSSLEKFLIYQNDLQEMQQKGKYDKFLQKKRDEYFKRQYTDNTQHVAVLKKEHDESQEFVTHMLENKKEQVKKFLAENNKGAPFNITSTTLCLMDATGSMSHLLNNAKLTVCNMFERASNVLKENHMSEDCFRMQFAVYRNYNSDADKIIQCSGYESNPSQLETFMKTIQPEGGWGNEAIEMALRHANKECAAHDISQIIIIGDAAANTEKEVENKRAEKGEKYWSENFGSPTHFRRELGALKNNKIKIHAYYVASSAKEDFTTMANETGGRVEELQINSSSGADRLTDLVTEEILRNAGGDKGNMLVEQYRKRYTN